MSVEDRHLYHEGLEAVFPPGIAVRITERQKIWHKKLLLIVLSVLAGAVYLWLRGFFG
jgi:hypothetical protein